MNKDVRNFIIGLLIVCFGIFIHESNKVCCPLGVTLGIWITIIGIAVIFYSLIMYDGEEARKEAEKEKQGGLNQEH